MKVIRLKLVKDPGAQGGFCMSVGSIVELYDGGFRNPEVNQNYYPVFGPYAMMEELANQLLDGTATPQAKELFEAVDVTDTIKPKLEHVIMDEAGGMKVCTINHKSLMQLLKESYVERRTDANGDDMYKLSNTLFKDDVVAHNIEIEA